MMLAMPGVHRQHFVQAEDTAVLGVPKPPGKVGWAQVPQQQQPALVEELEQGQRRLYRAEDYHQRYLEKHGLASCHIR